MKGAHEVGRIMEEEFCVFVPPSDESVNDSFEGQGRRLTDNDV